MPRTRNDIENDISNSLENINNVRSWLAKPIDSIAHYQRKEMSQKLTERIGELSKFQQELKEFDEEQKRKERESQRKEQERIEQERKEKELREKEHKEQERKERERKEQERREQELKEQERKERERKEQERIEEAKQRDIEQQNLDVKFLQDFIAELDAFNKTCEEFESKAEKDLEDLIQKQKNKAEQALKIQNENIDSFVSSKESALKDYKSKLQELNHQEKNRQNILYEKITQCKRAKSPEAEIENIRSDIFANKEQIKQECNKLWEEYQDKCSKILQERTDKQEKNNTAISNEAKEQFAILEKYKKELKENALKNINEAVQKFTMEKFNSKEINEKYIEILAGEPFVETYQCKKTNPKSVYIALLTSDLSTINLGKHAKNLLESHYPTLYRHGKLHIPYSISFKEGFNYLFNVNANNRDFIIDKAKSLAMRLFMMLPPNKVNFTFFDPIKLGDTFSLFRGLVDDNDPTKKVINGKIWTLSTDINERLRVLTDHISNVTQRYLQENYKNIQEYNEIAGPNAEPYQVLMIMDFPGEFSDESLRLLEKIISTGTKCGVYTVIIKNKEQVDKIDNKLLQYIGNIETHVTRFVSENDKLFMLVGGKTFPFFIKHLLPNKSLPTESSLFSSETLRNNVIEKLKIGIKEADKIEITFKDSILGRFPEEKWFKSNSEDKLVIPIGTHGAGNIQDISFGEEFGCFDALIVGKKGSGKSSLLHTIIMSSLIKYNTDELQIILIDFKEGVEFKTYANHKLDMFGAIAIVSEREFGNSVFDYLERELKNRAEKFKRENVEKILDYRKKSKNVMPRILLIIDEFQILFPRESDALSQKALKQLDVIIKQGRSYGFHVILATQSLAGVGGFTDDIKSQIGVRIALKCTKEDAQSVLRDDNDGIDLLTQDNPGQAIYNSNCGNKDNNTVIRVSYIDRDVQTDLLNKISERAKTLKLEQKPPKQETRILLSNVEENINSSYQKYLIPEFIEKENIFKENAVVVGESLDLFGNLKMDFTNDSKSNMLIIGEDEQKARTTFTFCVLSLILGYMNKHNDKKIDKPFINIIDFAPPEDSYAEDEDTLSILTKEKLQNFIKYAKYDEEKSIKKILKEVYDDIEKREDNSNYENKYLMVFGLQLADILLGKGSIDDKSSSGSVGLNIKQESNVTVNEVFLDIIKKGAEKGIHLIIWEDHFKNFMRNYSEVLESFGLRIGFTMPDDDSGHFMNVPYGSQISENNAIFKSHRSQKFRPYKKPDLEWLKKICERITQQ